MCGYDIDPDDETVATRSKIYASIVFNRFFLWYIFEKNDRYLPNTGMETILKIINK